MEKELQLIKKLTDARAIGGHEKQVRQIMAEEFAKSGATISYDNIGSIVGTYTGNVEGPKIVIAGHMDEIGFIITTITDEGFIKFHPIGGWWSHVMLAQQYDVTTSDGKVYRAVMGSKPPHMLSPEERTKTVDVDKMYLDLGVKSKDEVLALGIRPGDMITPAIEFQVMANSDFLLAKAFDNRVGCAIAIDVINNIKGEKTPNIVHGVGSVQEEVGCRGARTVGQMLNPNIVFALDVTIATDCPGLSNSCKMGKGPAIMLYDSSMIGHPGLRKFVTDIADELGIPYQLDYLARGGTDAGAMHLTNAGAPGMAICIPSRYIHSHTSMISRSDYFNTVKLLTEVVKRLDSEACTKITLG